MAPAPALNWTGCYVGIEGGGGFGDTTHIATTGLFVGATTTSGGLRGGLAGGTVGCNYQTGNWVLGAENDLSWTDYGGSHNNFAPFGVATVQTTSMRWLDTLRGRLGYANGPVLFYVTGGAAFTNVNINAAGPAAGVVSVSHNETGWTAGGGIEWALAAPHWSVKAEYLYVKFETTNYFLFGGNDVHLNENIVRGGVNYKF